MTINPNIFREFSIRGIAATDLTDEVVEAIGQATGAFFKQQGSGKIVVGRDARNSSPRLSRAIIRGLQQSGVNVVDVGLVPTPVHNFATDFYGVAGGVMVTASHNPPEYNGLKLRNRDRTLYAAEIQEIYRLTVNRPEEFTKSFGAEALGTVEQADILPIYLERLKAQAQQTFEVRSAKTSKVLKIVVDGGNGTNGLIVAGLLRDLGCEIIELYCEPDGNFPHRSPDPTVAGALTDLSSRVQAEKADLGLAYDGDGDRLALVDEQGRRVLGDQIMMILARDILQRGPAKIVYEILCTQALADDVVAHGGEPVMTPSGYAFVHEAMQQTGAALGGELSGHLFCHAPGFRFDDAILATVKLLNVVTASRQPLSALVAGLPAYHSSPELRLPCPDTVKAAVVTSVKTAFERDYQVDTLDGARIHFAEGWALVRQSNTQPVISMRFEARTAEALAAIQSRVQPLVEAEIQRQAQG